MSPKKDLNSIDQVVKQSFIIYYILVISRPCTLTKWWIESEFIHCTLHNSISIMWSIWIQFRYIKDHICHINKITLSSTSDLCSHVHQLWSTFAQLAVRTPCTSYILLHPIPCTFDPSVLDLLLSFHHSCVWLQKQLWLYFPSVSAFVCIWVQSKLCLCIYINLMYSVLRLQFEYHIWLTPFYSESLDGPTLTDLFTPCDKSLCSPLNNPEIQDHWVCRQGCTT